MAKPKLGTKRTCPTCGSRYYDLNRVPPACPKCGEAIRSKKPVEAVIPVEPVGTAAKPAPAPAKKAPAKKAPAKKAPAKKAPAKPRPAAAAPGKDDGDKKEAEELEPVKGGEEDDGVIEDASDIGEHNDDMAEVKEHVDEPVADIG